MRRKSVLALLLIAVILISIHFLLRSGPFSDRVTKFVTARIEKLTGIHLTLERATLSLIPAALVLEGVELPPTGPDTPPIAIKNIRVSFSPWSLFTEVIFIKKIVLTEPTVRLNFGDQNLMPFRWSPPRSSAENSNDKPRRMRAVIRDIQIYEGVLELRPANGPAILSLQHLEGHISPDLMMQTFDATGSAKNISVRQGAFHKTLDSISGRFILRPPVLEIRKLEAADSSSRYTLGGTIQNPASPEMNMTFSSDFPLSDFDAWMPDRLPLKGSAHFSGEARGIWPDLSFKGSLSATRIT
ncbi:MAG TPA: hypothetical protein VI702_01860, partial [Nitrospiria bacterium]